MKQIDINEYFTKDMLMESPLKAQNQFLRRGVKEYEFRKVLPDIIQKYDLVYKKANKALNKKLGISSKKYLLVQKNLIEE